jgi:hypothetical protein
MVWANAGAGMAMLDVQNDPGPNGVGRGSGLRLFNGAWPQRGRFPLNPAKSAGDSGQMPGCRGGSMTSMRNRSTRSVGVGFSLHMTQSALPGHSAQTLGPRHLGPTLGP